MNDRTFYKRGTEELRKKSLYALSLVKRLNQMSIEDFDKREELIRKLLGSVGVSPSIEDNFHCDLGYNIHVGDNFYAGFNCVMLDMAEIRIGNDCLIGPNVGIYTAGHRLTSPKRNTDGYGIPIIIGNNVWIGGSSTILPGVTIGDNAVIAGGSVVTKDVEAATLVAGSPARIVRKLEME